MVKVEVIMNNKTIQTFLKNRKLLENTIKILELIQDELEYWFDFPEDEPIYKDTLIHIISAIGEDLMIVSDQVKDNTNDLWKQLIN